ncbi:MULTISPECIES: helix-turn-helix domain-containing protein [Olivibacter]|uniref:Helix-turn-helix domain-containing protein n=1 Tax=Olivibacter oleidegradans TaxID=760123 RepID=A0ABV6HIG0_9SPHI|nr:helix-turn-helix transcriptional regulator [Olivibacter jilunii]
METKLEQTKIFATIGANLHTVRNAKKKTLEAVASDLNITHPVLSKIENGRYPGLSLALLFTLCEYYGVTFEQILDINGSKIFNYSQYINQPTGNHTLNNQIGDGYEIAIKAYKEQIQQLQDQNQLLITSLLDKQQKK